MLPVLPSLDSAEHRGNMEATKGGRMYPKFTAPKTLTKAEQRRLLRAVRATAPLETGRSYRWPSAPG